MPFDHTRIMLKPLPGTSDNEDYINANRIDVLADYPEFGQITRFFFCLLECYFHSCRTYITTQGCLPNTVDDFWRMIYQENCHLCVMVTREIERGRVNCVGRMKRTFALTEQMRALLAGNWPRSNVRQHNPGEYNIRRESWQFHCAHFAVRFLKEFFSKKNSPLECV